MASLPKVFAHVALLREAAQQFGRAEALLASLQINKVTPEEHIRLTAEYSTWKERLHNRQQQLDAILRGDYL